jgi:hypothetical protein
MKQGTIIELTGKDLVHQPGPELKDIITQMFSTFTLPKEELEKASVVIFYDDDGSIKVLKDNMGNLKRELAIT